MVFLDTLCNENIVGNFFSLATTLAAMSGDEDNIINMHIIDTSKRLVLKMVKESKNHGHINMDKSTVDLFNKLNYWLKRQYDLKRKCKCKKHHKHKHKHKNKHGEDPEEHNDEENDEYEMEDDNC